MTKRMLVMAAVLGLALAMAGAARAEIKIGVVDIAEVADNYQWSKDARDALKREMAVLQADSAKRVANITDMRLERDHFGKDTKEWKERDEVLLNEEARVSTWQMLEQYKIDRRNRDLLLDMYKQITLVVERLAKKHKLDLVFSKAFLAPADMTVNESQGLDDLKRRIQNQRVIYPGPGMDLTQETIEILNAEYDTVRPPAIRAAPLPSPAPPAPSGTRTAPPPATKSPLPAPKATTPPPATKG